MLNGGTAETAVTAEDSVIQDLGSGNSDRDWTAGNS